MLTHEFAHVVLHDHVTTKHLKDGVQERLRILRMSLENQADEFAQHFLAPEHIVRKMNSIGQIMDECAVSFDLAVNAGKICGIRPRRRLQPYEVMALNAGDIFDDDI